MQLTIPYGIFSHGPPGELTGELELGIARHGDRSVAAHQYHTRALKVIRPHYLDDSGQVYYIIVNPGGGFVGGDSYRIDVDVAAGASLLLTDQSAAEVYRTPGNFVVQNLKFTVGKGAVLEYIPDQLILYRDADFRQSITAEVDPEGSLFFSDIVTPGWSPDGARFAYQQARLRNVVSVGGELVLLDNMHFVPKTAEFSEDAQFYMGGRTHVATAVCFDPGVDSELIDAARELIVGSEGGAAEVVASVTAMDRPGFVVRALGNRTEELLGLIKAVAGLVRGRLRGQGEVSLRQY
ncbi:urease accessory protein UreD [Corynebacterium atypicum]|uniref:urease accessory protein UreD n=1 Tax=Corynebacterium atypicum TaxID=191610 RepID=UPI00056F216B|nr:urease accessory protein UreD [Corynebacterium atypicum]